MNPSLISPRTTADAAPTPVFGVNEMRLGVREWLWVLASALALAWGMPWWWRSAERFEVGVDYRIPYALSRDYWLYQRRLELCPDPGAVIVLGDSVVWGEYVSPDGTLTHFLDRESGVTNRFVNAGVNGLFPLAMEGLVTHYSREIGARRVVVHFNPLWMTSAKADLSSPKPEAFNHSRLVPQFFPSIPSYRADAAERLSAAIEHRVEFFRWVNHVEHVSFDQKSLPAWTLADDGSDPPRYPNLWRNPLRRITGNVPDPREPDGDRGLGSARHRPWNRNETRTVEFEWVGTSASWQWAAFRRVVERLRRQNADVFVLVGPFNESMLGSRSRERYERLRRDVGDWLTSLNVPHLTPPALPSELYADASHPLTEGYAMLAKQITASKEFQTWLQPGTARSRE